MFEGDITEGELEVGQVSAMINRIMSVDNIMSDMLKEYNMALRKVMI